MLPKLMLVTDRQRTRHRPLVEVVADAVAGGVGIVQLRDKDLPREERLELARELARVVAGRARLIVNGDAELARIVGAGLHLPADAAAPRPRPKQTVGRSTHDDGEIERAVAEAADYVIFGPAFPTESKPGHPGAGLSRVEHAARAAAPIPLFAIGGVTTSRIPEVIHAGAWGVAICGAILSASNPRRIAEAMSLALTVSSA